MSESTQAGPVMDGSDDASNDDKLAGLTEQVEQDHRDGGAAEAKDDLRERMVETDTEPEGTRREE